MNIPIGEQGLLSTIPASIPPKYSVAQVIGYIKGKSTIAVARLLGGKKRNFNGQNLWVRGYAVSTVGFELQGVRRHIQQIKEPPSLLPEAA